MDDAAAFDAAQAYGHAVLDAVSVSGEDDDGRLMNLAAQRALDVDAVELTVEDGGKDVTVDLSRALGGTLILVNAMVAELRLHTGLEEEVIIATIRERFDGAFAP